MDIFNNNDLGVTPTPITTTQGIGYANVMFGINGKFYLIEKNNDDPSRIHKLITLFKDDEFIDSGNDIFTYIIGTEYIIDSVNKTITRNPTIDNCDVSKMHLWAKPAVTVQEIESKHGIIISDLVENHDTIFNQFKNNENLDETLLHDNSIDQLYYAGEMKYDSNTKKLHINFMSGTYMLGVVDYNNPSQAVRNCITKFFNEKIGINIDNIDIDTSGQTYITQQMTIEQLNTYVNNGIKVYVFDNETDARTYTNKDINLAKLGSQKIMNDRMLNKFPANETYINKSKELNNEIDRLNSITATLYIPESYGGRKTRKCRNCKCNNYSRKNKIRRNRKK